MYVTEPARVKDVRPLVIERGITEGRKLAERDGTAGVIFQRALEQAEYSRDGWPGLSLKS